MLLNTLKAEAEEQTRNFFFIKTWVVTPTPNPQPVFEEISANSPETPRYLANKK